MDKFTKKAVFNRFLQDYYTHYNHYLAQDISRLKHIIENGYDRLHDDSVYNQILKYKQEYEFKCEALTDLLVELFSIKYRAFYTNYDRSNIILAERSLELIGKRLELEHKLKGEEI
jgi:hypothetical protein